MTGKMVGKEKTSDQGEGIREMPSVGGKFHGLGIPSYAVWPLTNFFLFRYRSTLNYALLDSCPQIFNNNNGQALKNNIAVTTSLSTDSELSGRLKSLRSTVTRLIGLEDRETLSNELAEMADEYHEGWSSGSDDGEDND